MRVDIGGLTAAPDPTPGGPGGTGRVEASSSGKSAGEDARRIHGFQVASLGPRYPVYECREDEAAPSTRSRAGHERAEPPARPDRRPQFLGGSRLAQSPRTCEFDGVRAQHRLGRGFPQVEHPFQVSCDVDDREGIFRRGRSFLFASHSANLPGGRFQVRREVDRVEATRWGESPSVETCAASPERIGWPSRGLAGWRRRKETRIDGSHPGPVHGCRGKDPKHRPQLRGWKHQVVTPASVASRRWATTSPRPSSTSCIGVIPSNCLLGLFSQARALLRLPRTRSMATTVR